MAHLNNIKNPDKIKENQILKIDPERDFTNNPHGGYSNPNNSEGKEMSFDNVFAVGAQFVYGLGAENEIITSGHALDAIRNWDKVQELVTEGAKTLWKDGKLKPGETFLGSYHAPSLLNYTGRSLEEKEKFWTPIHVIGSFNLSMRVNADGYTVTVAVYDSKTIASLSDNTLGKGSNKANTAQHSRDAFSTQYTRFIWDVIIPQP